MKKTAAKLALTAKLLGATALSSLLPGVAQAQSAPVVANDGRTQVYQSANGTTVVNIAAPNAAGVSHNRFDQYNVPDAGVVLNNGGLDQQQRQSQLAGAVAGNANIAGAQASLIINEVVKANPSLMTGYTEVLGGRADLVVANPWGVTCSGCGFVNVAHLVLSTGVPQLSNEGRLTGLRTTDGVLTIAGRGLDASAADTLALVARSVKIDGQINARALDVVGGASTYDTTTGDVVVIAGSDKPQYAIDASALGSLYAGRIRLIATEAGVGVRALGNVGATAGDLTITSAGSIVIGGRASATAAVAARAAGGDLTLDHALVTAGTSLTLEALAGRLVLTGGQLNAGTTLTAHAASLADTGGVNAATDTNRRDAAGGLVFQIAGDANLAGVVWSGATAALSAANTAFANATLAADTATLRTTGLSIDQGGVQGKTLDIGTTGTLALTATAYLQAENALTAGGSSIVNAGRLSAGADPVRLTGALTNTGMIQGYGLVDIEAGSAAIANSGTIAAGTLTLAGAALTNSGKAQAASGATITTASLNNSGTLTGTTSAAAGLTLTVPTIVNTGRIESAGLTTVAATIRLDNGGVILGNELSLAGGAVANTGTVQATTAVVLNGGAYTNAGVIQAGTRLTLTADSLADSGTLTAGIGDDGQGVLTLGSLQLAAGGVIRSAGTLAITTSGGQTIAGSAIGQKALTLTAGGPLALTGSGLAGSVGAVTITTGGTGLSLGAGTSIVGASAALTGAGLRNAGTIQVDGTLGIDGGTATLVNDGTLRAGGGAVLKAGDIADNGLIATGADLSLIGATLTVGGAGSLTTQGALTATVGSGFANAGSVVAVGALTLNGTATSIVNTGYLQGAATTIDAGNAALANTATGSNGGLIVADALTLRAASLNNSGQIQSTNAAALALSGAFVNAASGLLNARAALALSAGRLVNVGAVQALGGLTADIAHDLTNSGTLVAAGAAGQTASLTAGTLANSGTLVSYGSLDVRQANGFANTGTLAAAGDLALHGDGSGVLTLDGAVQSGGTTTIDAASSRVTGAAGLQLVGNDVRIISASFDNAGTFQANRDVVLTSTGSFANQASGTLNALGTATFTVGAANNAGGIQALHGGSFTAGDFTDTGLFIAGTAAADRFNFAAGALTIAAAGRIQGGGTIGVALRGTLTNAGILYAGGDLQLSNAAGNPLAIVSSAGSVLEADGTLDLTSAGTALSIGTGATWIAGTLRMRLASLDIGGILQSNGSADLTLGGALNVAGTLYASGQATASAASIADTGLIQAGALALTSANALSIAGGLLVASDATGSSTITATTLSNTPAANGAQSGVQAAGDLRVVVNGALANTGLLLAQGNLTLAGTGLTIGNTVTGTIRSLKTLDISAPGTGFTSQAGGLFGQRLTVLATGDLVNGGQIVGFGGTNAVAATGALTNVAGGLIYFGHTSDAADRLSTLSATTLTNNGTIQADNYLTLFARTFTNSAAMTSADTLDFRFTGGDATSGGGSLTNTGLIRAGTLNIGYDRADTAALPTTHPVNLGTYALITNTSRIDGEALTLRGTIVNNAGAVVLGSTSLATISDTLTNYGLIGSQGDFALGAASVVNQAGAGIAAGRELFVAGTPTNGSNQNFVNNGSVFATSISANTASLTNNAGATLDAANGAAFVTTTFVNHGAMTAGTDLTIVATTLTNDVGYVQIDTDQPSYFNPNWNDSSGNAANANSIHGRGDLYHQGRLEVENADGSITPFGGRMQADVYSIDNDTNGYNYAYRFTQTIRNLGALVKPTLISNGNMSLTFNQGLNRGGVISASNTLTLNGQGNAPTFTIDNVQAYITDWASSWDDYCNNGCTVFRSYEQHITRKVSNGSVGASMAATTINGGQGSGAFALVIDGNNQGGGVSAVPKDSPRIGTATPVRLSTGATVSAATVSVGVGAVATASGAASITAAGTIAAAKGVTVSAAPPAALPRVSVVPVSGAGTAAVVSSNYDAGIKGSVSGTPSISFGTTTVTLPTSPSGRFVPTSDPATGYLIEGNPLFTGRDGIGSDLLARLLGLDPDGLIRRLGDASYEGYLIHQQLIDSIGTNLITRGLTEAQQTEALMRSASSQAKPLGLTYGKALTATQQANLKTDLVWMVATQVNGQTVLAPVVYLSADTRSAFDKGDATIAANYVNLALTSLVNDGGTIKGSTLLSIDAKGDITNTSGRISGGTVLLTAGGDVTNQTFSRYGGNDRSGSTQIGATGSITATNGLMLKGGGDIKNLGATIFSGGPTALIAGKDVIVDTIVDRRAGATAGTQTSSATNVASILTVSGDLYTSAGRDVTIGGSKVAVSGMADVEAGRDVNLISRADTSTKTTQATGGNLFHRTSTETTETSTTSQGSSLSSGDLYVKSGRDTNVQGSRIATTGDAAFDVGRDMNVLADTDKTTKSVSTRDTGLGVGDALFGDRQKQSYDETGKTVGSSISIGGNGTVVAKGDLNLTGSKLHTDGDLSGHVANLTITDASDYTLHTEKETLTTVLGGSAGGSVGGSASGQAGGYAGGHSGGVDATTTGGVGAQVGGGHAATTGIVASTDVSSYNARGAIDPKLADEKEGELRPAGSSIANGVASNGTINALQASGAFDAADAGGSAMERGQTGANSAGFAVSGKASGSVNGNVGITLAQSQTTSSRDFSSTSVGSELSAGGKLTMIADNDMTIRGSQVKAGADALLGARNITVTAGQNVEEHSRDSMTTGVGVFVGSSNTASVGAEAKGSVGTTGTQNVTNGRSITGSGGGAGTGGNLGETGGSVSANVNVQGASNNDVDLAHNIQTSDSSRSVANQASSIAAGGKLTMIATDKLSVTGSDLSGDAGVGLRARNMEFLAAQDTTTSSSSNRTTAVGFFAGGDASAAAGASAGADSKSKAGAAGASASTTGEVGAGVQARNAMDMTSSSTSTARVSSITSKDGSIVRVADNDITDVGTTIKAGKDVLQQSATFTSKAAQNTSSASAATFVDRVREGVYAEAGAGAGSDASAQSGAGSQQATASASKTGGASAGVASSLLHSDQQNSNGTSTAVVSTIDAGGRFVSVTTGKTSLEGTQLKSGGDMTIAAGSLDFTAARDTSTTSDLANSLKTKVQLGVDAEKVASGYAEATYTGSGKDATATTSHAGTADAGGKLTIVSQGKTNLEGTQLSSGSDMTLYSKDDLNFTAAHDTKSGVEHEQSLGVSASFAGKRGENVAGKVEVGVGVTKEDTATAGSMTSGGSLVVVSDKNATFQGTAIKGVGTTAVIAAGDLNIGTADSAKDNYAASVGLGASASRAGETSATGKAGATGTGTTTTASKPVIGTRGTATAAPAAATPTTTSSTLLARSNEDQQFGTEANASFSMEKSTTRQAGSVTSIGGDVVLKSGGDMNLAGTAVKAAGTAALDAGKNLTFGTADSTSIKVDAGVDLMGTRGSPGGVGTHVLDSSSSISTDGRGANTSNASGTQANQNTALQQSAAASEDTKLHGGAGITASGAYTSTQDTGSISATNVVTRSGGNTTFVGTDIDAAKTASITAGGNVDFKAATNVNVDASFGASAEAEGHAGSKVGGKTATGATGTTTAAPAAAGTAAQPSTWSAATKPTVKDPTSLTGGQAGAGAVSTTVAPTQLASGGAGAMVAASVPKEDKPEVHGGVTDMGIGVGVTNKGSTVNAQSLTINSGGSVSMNGTTGDVGSSAINAVNGVNRTTTGSASAEIGMTRLGGSIDVQKADLGANGTTTAGAGARGAVQSGLAAVTPTAGLTNDARGAAGSDAASIGGVTPATPSAGGLRTVPSPLQATQAFAGSALASSVAPTTLASTAAPAPAKLPLAAPSAPLAPGPATSSLVPIVPAATVTIAQAPATGVALVAPIAASLPAPATVPIASALVLRSPVDAGTRPALPASVVALAPGAPVVAAGVSIPAPSLSPASGLAIVPAIPATSAIASIPAPPTATPFAAPTPGTAAPTSIPTSRPSVSPTPIAIGSPSVPSKITAPAALPSQPLLAPAPLAVSAGSSGVVPPLNAGAPAAPTISWPIAASSPPAGTMLTTAAPASAGHAPPAGTTTQAPSPSVTVTATMRSTVMEQPANRAAPANRAVPAQQIAMVDRVAVTPAQTPSAAALTANAPALTAEADRLARQAQPMPSGAVTAPFGQIAIRLPDRMVHWSVEGSTLRTWVDVSEVPQGKRPRLLLPDGTWAPKWLVLDRDTGVVSGTVPPREGSAAAYLSKAHVGVR